MQQPLQKAWFKLNKCTVFSLNLFWDYSFLCLLKDGIFFVKVICICMQEVVMVDQWSSNKKKIIPFRKLNAKKHCDPLIISILNSNLCKGSLMKRKFVCLKLMGFSERNHIFSLLWNHERNLLIVVLFSCSRRAWLYYLCLNYLAFSPSTLLHVFMYVFTYIFHYILCHYILYVCEIFICSPFGNKLMSI